MITGTHLLFYSSDPGADRDFLRDVLEFKYVDTGHDWLIFKLPPAEAGVHPLEGPNLPDAAKNPAGGMDGYMIATVWLMVDDIEAAREQLKAKGVESAEAHNEGWGISTSFALPSGARVGLYQPLHEVAIAL